jgi:hypothetical protein
MKKHFLIIIMLISVLAGCKLDEAGFKQNSVKPVDGNNQTDGSIVGMWFLQTQHTVGKALGFPIDEISAGTANDYYLFNADGTVKISTADDGIVNGTYTYDSGSKKLSVTNNGQTITFSIATLNATTMVINTSVSVPALDTQTDVTFTYSR